MAVQNFPLGSTILLSSHRKDHLIFYNILNKTYKGYWLRNGDRNCPITIWKEEYNLCIDAGNPPNIVTCLNDTDYCETPISFIKASPFSDIWITDNELIIGTTDMRDGVDCPKFTIPSNRNELCIKFVNDGVLDIYHIKSKKVISPFNVQDIITCR
jgi:hypothetical protein